MIYQHATTVEDRAIADRLSGLVDAHRAESDDASEVNFLATKMTATRIIQCSYPGELMARAWHADLRYRR